MVLTLFQLMKEKLSKKFLPAMKRYIDYTQLNYRKDQNCKQTTNSGAIFKAATFSGIIQCFSSLIANVHEFFTIVNCITNHQSTFEETDMKFHIELV